MITIVSKVQARRGLQVELPGAPISTSPLVLAPGLDIAEMGFTEDTARLFIGYEPTVNDPNFKRGVFPYQNLEILTESSPRNKELFNGFIRDQDARDFFVPVAVPIGGMANLPYPGGTFDPSKITNPSFSATFEYHAFSATNEPVKQGILRLTGNGGTGTISDVNNVGSTSLTFAVSYSGGAYFLQCQNGTSSSVNLYIRRVVVGL